MTKELRRVIWELIEEARKTETLQDCFDLREKYIEIIKDFFVK